MTESVLQFPYVVNLFNFWVLYGTYNSYLGFTTYCHYCLHNRISSIFLKQIHWKPFLKPEMPKGYRGNR